MKRPSFRREVLCALAATPMLACETLEDFDIRLSGRTIITHIGGKLVFAPFDAFDGIGVSGELRERDIDPDRVESIRVRTLNVVLEWPKDATFDFLESIELFALTPESERMRIAHAFEIPPVSREIRCELDDVDLKAFAKEIRFFVDTEMVGVDPGRDIELRANLVLDVYVGLFG